MKLRIISTFLVISTVSIWAVACGNTQGRPACLVGHGLYAVKYLPTGSPTGSCAANKGEIIGVEKYDDLDAQKKNPDTKSIVAIRPSGLVDQEGPGQGASGGVADLKTIAQGPLKDVDPDANNVCTAPTLAEVHDQVGGTPLSYTFSNVRFFVTPRVPGTQFSAQLDYVGTDNCKATYNVLGVYPATTCGDENGQPQDSLCALPGDNGQINPDFKVKCDPDLLLCVLDSNTTTLPVLKK